MNYREYIDAMKEEPDKLWSVLNWLRETFTGKEWAWSLDITINSSNINIYTIGLVSREGEEAITLKGPFELVYAALDGICEHAVKQQAGIF